MAPRKLKGFAAVCSADLMTLAERRALYAPTDAASSTAAASAAPSAVLPRPGTKVVASQTTADIPDRTSRNDGPVVKATRRASYQTAVAGLQAQGLDSLIGELQPDRVAKSAKGDKASHMATWTRFHTQAFPPAPPAETRPVLPLTIIGLLAVAALFKKGRYASYPNYASTVKGLHVEAGFVRAQLLDHTAKWVKRSLERGVGPSRQSSPLNVYLLLGLEILLTPLTVTGPLWPLRVLLGIVFML